MVSIKFQPVIKWSGSKRKQSEEIIKNIPKEKYSDGTYKEVCCGGCSVLFQLLHSDIKFKKYVCSDTNEDLINLWNLIKTEPQNIIKEYSRMWNELNIDEDLERKKQYFYMVRRRLNDYHNPIDFMFILRTCVNGMPRYNKRGEFNTSFHVTRKGIKPKTLEKIILQWSQLLNKFNVKFIVSKFEDIQCNKGDLIYVDPPYKGTKGMYYGSLKNYNILWNWLREQPCDYILSFDGKTTSEDKTQNIPKDIYNEHKYLNNGNSSFSRIVGSSNEEYVNESLYIKIKQI